MARYVIDNRPEPINFECNGNARERTIQNCKNLLMTKMGEVPYDRLRGFNTALFDLPIGEMNEKLTRELDRLMMWEPDAEVVGAEAYIDENGQTVIQMTVEINL